MVEAGVAGDGRKYLEADIAFHSAILHGSGNAVIGHFATTVEALLRTRTEERRFTITEYTPPAPPGTTPWRTPSSRATPRAPSPPRRR